MYNTDARPQQVCINGFTLNLSSEPCIFMRHYLWHLRILTHAKLSYSGAWNSIPPFIKPSLDQEGQHVQGCCTAVYGLFAGENFYVHRRRDTHPLNLTCSSKW